MCFVFFFKQKTAYEMRISDWSSDVCSSDLQGRRRAVGLAQILHQHQRSPIRRRGQQRHDNNRQESHWRAEHAGRNGLDRKSVVEGKSVSVRVDLGGRRIIKKKNNITNKYKQYNNRLQN